MTTGSAHLAAPPETLDRDPVVTAVMSTGVVAVTPDTTVLTALTLMATAGVRHLPVIDCGSCRGVLHEQDVIRHLVAGLSPGIDAAATRVDQLVRRAISVPASARRSEAARRMAVEGGDAVLVAGRLGPVGIVTATDLVRSLAAEVATAR